MPAGNTFARQAVVGIGDSIGEGVQGADAAWQTQAYSYLNLLNYQIGGDLTLPYIQSGLFGMVGDPAGRQRIYPNDMASNVAVSGATVNSLLYQRAIAQTQAQISNETELVLYPRLQTQMEYVESAKPVVILCWIGNNDVLSAALAFGNMNASQLTPVADFERDYIAMTDRLGTLVSSNGSAVVFANIPDVTSIGFLVNRANAEAMTGFPVPLPDGHYTSILGVLLMKFLGDASLVNDPNFVLDNTEVTAIRDRTQAFNDIIQREADRIGMPVVDINAKFNEYLANPPVFAGRPLTNTILGGLFSLDGVHPSNIGHALITNEFIKTINQAFNVNVPEFSPDTLNFLYLLDPSIDKDGDGKATGRLGVGLIETLAFLLGFTGDTNDF
ncbi:MAG: SGNH/GDSL hydrolase family protein [Gammaproteobacteria bacterium]|nr:SGNH/GDSL hydrolase family protein [Gammaproteobacteria bacterium]MDH3537551.1 SGNH/GDSL hydrolase family protein [Gammaproteobacteria bacterium]